MRLLYLDRSDLESFIKTFEKDAKAIKDELLRLCWNMRGGLTYSESFLLDHEEREIISDIIDSNIKITKETGLPYF